MATEVEHPAAFRRRFRRRVLLAVPAPAALDWHRQPDAIQLLTPSWAPVEVVQPASNLDAGVAVLRLAVGFIRLNWVARHVPVDDPLAFRDVQDRGPFAHWIHTHRFRSLAQDLCELEDDVEFELPGGRLINRFFAPLVERRLPRLFALRHAVLRRELGAGTIPASATSGRAAAAS